MGTFFFSLRGGYPLGMRGTLLLTPILVLLAAGPAAAATAEVVPGRSVIAIVTHKAGMASGMAHEHVIAASNYTTKLEFDPGTPTATRFDFRAQAHDLVVDDPNVREPLFDRLKELGIVSEPFKKITEENRSEVRKSMLGPKQLDAEHFPEISGTILGVEAKPKSDDEFPFLVKIAFEAHGQRVEREIDARFVETEGGYELEAFGELAFTELGVKPYSAFMGAVRNQDAFHLYVRISASSRPRPKP